MSPSIRVIIPFRLREGADPRRAANLDIVQAWWYAHGFDPQIVSDGLDGDAQFNRHRAYNRAVSGNAASDNPADVFVFTEADMLVHPDQIMLGVRLATRQQGLVVPFTRYHYLSDSMTEVLRDDYRDSSSDNIAEFWSRKPGSESVFDLTAESVMDDGKSIGAVNIVSRETLETTGGFTEATSGNWYDDNITEEGFHFLTGVRTRFVIGPAVHLYHLPGHKGDHLSHEDQVATARNKNLLHNMRRDIRFRRADRVRALMQVRKPEQV